MIPQQECMGAPVFPKADQHRILSNFWLFIHLMGKSEHLSVVLICMPYVMSEITHLFNIFKTHLYFLFGELSINMLCPFLLVFFFLICWNVLYRLGILGLCLPRSLSALFNIGRDHGRARMYGQRWESLGTTLVMGDHVYIFIFLAAWGIRFSLLSLSFLIWKWG